MIKKLMGIVLAAAVAVSLCACSGDGENSSSSSSVPKIDAKVSAEPKSTAAPVKNVEVAVVSDDGVNIRAGASTDDEILSQANKGDAFYLVQKDAAEGWNKITYNGKDAYISADYSSISSVTESEARSMVAGETPGDATPSPDPAGSENEPGSSTSSNSSSSGPAEASRSTEDGQRR